MWFSGFPRLVFMAAMLCTLAAAKKSRVVRYASTLKLDFSSPDDDGWKLVKGPGDFFAEVYVSEDDKYIAVSQMLNPGHVFDSYEAVLSIWERESGLSAGELQRIKYYDVNRESDISIFNEIFTAFGYHPAEEQGIPEISIKRDSDVYQEHWWSLSRTTFGSDAIDICIEFKETNGLYIQSFDIGRTGYDARWIRVNFEMGEHDDEDDSEDDDDDDY
ncbi:hypothetical protein CFIMG_008219RA00001 [Ceratocystis fimbriata CBS 114723]|uniref:Uncharacterized protein n=1 Tax=Ceratocystis fimbriata CBS 114723 TaxID=1035309 RepID=A0A2C5X5W2_9PEZI|nr:hypothetical protein CFIMG_008219RA00001 [Ceratocystis fimbriata CBS 114723]